jgi:hypothetical protein
MGEVEKDRPAVAEEFDPTEIMNVLAKQVDDFVNAGRPREERDVAFVLLVFPIDAVFDPENHAVSYISNLTVEPMEAMLEWFLARRRKRQS